MGALPVIADVSRVALNWRHSNGQIAVNVMHFQFDAGAVNDATFRTELDAAADAAMWTPCSLNATVEDIAITRLDGVTGTTHGPPATPAHWTGTNADPFVPAESGIVKFTTGLRGRSHRGRLFLPFIVDAAVTDGLFGSGEVSATSAAWDDFYDDLVGGANVITPVVASYKLATATAIVKPIALETPAGTMRRRQGRLRGA